MFIGELRRKLFIPVDHEWNGAVRDITAKCETSDMEVDSAEVCDNLSKFYRTRATLALFHLQIGGNF